MNRSTLKKWGELVEEGFLTTTKAGQKIADAVEGQLRGGGTAEVLAPLLHSLISSQGSQGQKRGKAPGDAQREDDRLKGLIQDSLRALLHTYQRMVAEAGRSGNVAIVSGAPPTHVMEQLCFVLDSIYVILQGTDHAACLESALEKLLATSSTNDPAWPTVYTTSGHARVRSLLRRVLCCLRQGLDWDGVLSQGPDDRGHHHVDKAKKGDGGDDEKECSSSSSSWEVVRDVLAGLRRLQEDVTRRRTEAAAGGKGAAVSVQINCDSPSLSQTPLSTWKDVMEGLRQFGSMPIQVQGAGVSDVCGCYLPVLHTASSSSPPSTAPAAMPPGAPLPSPPPTSWRTSGPSVFRHESRPLEIFSTCTPTGSRHHEGGGGGEVLTRWFIGDPESHRVWYTAVGVGREGERRPPSQGWRPTRFGAWPGPVLTLLMTDCRGGSPQGGQVAIDGRPSTPANGAAITATAAAEGEEGGGSSASQAFTLASQRGIHGDGTCVSASDDRHQWLPEASCASISGAAASPCGGAAGAVGGGPRRRRASARIRDERRRCTSLDSTPSSQGSGEEKKKQKRRCHSETCVLENGDVVAVEGELSPSPLAASCHRIHENGSEERCAVPSLSQLMHELREWKAVPGEGDWGPVPDLPSLETYLTTKQHGRGGGEHDGQLAALYDVQCMRFVEQEAVLRRQLQESSEQKGSTPAEFVRETWVGLEGEVAAVMEEEGGRDDIGDHGGWRWEEVVARLWEKRVVEWVEGQGLGAREQDPPAGAGRRGTADGTVAHASEEQGNGGRPGEPEAAEGGASSNIVEARPVDAEICDIDKGQQATILAREGEPHLKEAEDEEEDGAQEGRQVSVGGGMTDVLGVHVQSGVVISTIIEVLAVELVPGGETEDHLTYLIRVTNVEKDDDGSDSGAVIGQGGQEGLLRHRIRVLRKPLASLISLDGDILILLQQQQQHQQHSAALSPPHLPHLPVDTLSSFETAYLRQQQQVDVFPTFSLGSSITTTGPSARVTTACSHVQEYLRALVACLPDLPTVAVAVVKDFFVAATASPAAVEDLVIKWTLVKKVKLTAPSREDMLQRQGGRCRGCGCALVSARNSSSSSFLGLGSSSSTSQGEYMRCEYLGALFCTTHCCYPGDAKATTITMMMMQHIPGDVVYNWDFSKKKVCRLAQAFLSHMSCRPVLRLSALNPSLFTKVEGLKHVRSLREQLCDLRAAIDKSQCAEAQALLGAFASSRSYVVLDREVFSMHDLADLHQAGGDGSTLTDTLTAIVEALNDHVVEDCRLCRTKGCSTCAVCCHGDPLFPYQVWRVSQCGLCQQLFHTACTRGEDLRHGCRGCRDDHSKPTTT